MKKRNPQYKVNVYQAYMYNLKFDDSYIDHRKNLKIKLFKRTNKEWMQFIKKIEIQIKVYMIMIL